MNINQPQTEDRFEQPKEEFKSSFKTWIRTVAFILVAVFLPEQVAQAVEYDWRVLWNKPAVGSVAPGYLKDLSSIDTALAIRNILKDVANKPVNAIKVSSNLTITLDKPLKMSNQRIEEITEWLKGKPCGSKALYDYLNYAGIKAAEGDIAIMALTVDILNDVVKPVGKPEVIKNSLYALSQAAKFFGANLYPVKIKADTQLNNLTPFIAHLKIGHYILVTRVTEDKVYYSEQHKEEFLPQATFLERFSGYALTSVLPAELQVLAPAESKQILGASEYQDYTSYIPPSANYTPAQTAPTSSYSSYATHFAPTSSSSSASSYNTSSASVYLNASSRSPSAAAYYTAHFAPARYSTSGSSKVLYKTTAKSNTAVVPTNPMAVFRQIESESYKTYPLAIKPTNNTTTSNASQNKSTVPALVSVVPAGPASTVSQPFSGIFSSTLKTNNVSQPEPKLVTVNSPAPASSSVPVQYANQMNQTVQPNPNMLPQWYPGAPWNAWNNSTGNSPSVSSTVKVDITIGGGKVITPNSSNSSICYAPVKNNLTNTTTQVQLPLAICPSLLGASIPATRYMATTATASAVSPIKVQAQDQSGKWVDVSNGFNAQFGGLTAREYAPLFNQNTSGSWYANNWLGAVVNTVNAEGYSSTMPFIAAFMPVFGTDAKGLTLTGVNPYMVAGNFYVDRSTIQDRAVNNNILIRDIPQQQIWQAAADPRFNGASAQWFFNSASYGSGAELNIMSVDKNLHPTLYVARTGLGGVVNISLTGFVKEQDLRLLSTDILKYAKDNSNVRDDIDRLWSYDYSYDNLDKPLYSATINGNDLGIISPLGDLGSTPEGGLNPIFRNVRLKNDKDASTAVADLEVGVNLAAADLTKGFLGPINFGVNSHNITARIANDTPVGLPSSQSTFSVRQTEGLLASQDKKGELITTISPTDREGFSKGLYWSGSGSLPGTLSAPASSYGSFAEFWAVNGPQAQNKELSLNMQYARLIVGAGGAIDPFSKIHSLFEGQAIIATPEGSHYENYGSTNYIGVLSESQLEFISKINGQYGFAVKVALDKANGGDKTFEAFDMGWHKVSLVNPNDQKGKNYYLAQYGDLSSNGALLQSSSVGLQKIDINGKPAGAATPLSVTFGSVLTDSGVLNLGFRLNKELNAGGSPWIKEPGATAGAAAELSSRETGTRAFIKLEGADYVISTPDNIGGVIGLPLQLSSNGLNGGLAFGEGTRFWSPQVAISSKSDMSLYKDQYVQIGDDYAWNLQGNKITDGRLSYDMQKASTGSNDYNTAIYYQASAYDIWQDPFNKDRILESIIIASPGSLGFGSLALGKLAIGQKSGFVNPSFSLQLLDKNTEISQKVFSATTGKVIESISNIKGEVNLLADNSLSFKTFSAIYARPTVYEGEGGTPAPDLGHSEYTLTKVAGAETIYKMAPKKDNTANLMLSLDAKSHWMGSRTGQQVFANIDFPYRNVDIGFGSAGDYALGIQRKDGNNLAAGGLTVAQGEVISLDKQGAVLALNTAGFWQPIEGRTFTAQFSDKSDPNKAGIAIGEFSKRISWDRQGNIFGIDNTARFQTEKDIWRNVTAVSGGNGGEPLSVTLSNGRQPLFVQGMSGAETITPPVDDKTFLKDHNATMDLGKDGWLSGVSSNFISSLNYNFAGTIAQDLRGYSIHNASGFSGDLGLIGQLRDGTQVAKGGLLFSGADETVSFNEAGQLKVAHAGYWAPLVDANGNALRYTATFQNTSGTALGEFGTRVEWDTLGNIKGIDYDAKFMTEPGKWRDVKVIAGIPSADGEGYSNLNVTLSGGIQPLYLTNTSRSTPADQAKEIVPPTLGTGRAPSTLDLTPAGQLSGVSSNFISNLNYNFSGAIASDLRNYTIQNQGADFKLDYQAIVDDAGNIIGKNQLVFSDNSKSASFDAHGNLFNGRFTQDGSVINVRDGQVSQVRDGGVLAAFALAGMNMGGGPYYELPFSKGANERNAERLNFTRDLVTPGSVLRQELALTEASLSNAPVAGAFIEGAYGFSFSVANLAAGVFNGLGNA